MGARNRNSPHKSGKVITRDATDRRLGTSTTFSEACFTVTCQAAQQFVLGHPQGAGDYLDLARAVYKTTDGKARSKALGLMEVLANQGVISKDTQDPESGKWTRRA